MKTIIKPLLILVVLGLIFSLSGCLKKDLEELTNSNLKVMSTVDYTYRFFYTDTIKKGTLNQEIQKDRVCEVVLKKQVEKLTENNIEVFKTTLTHDINSVMKAGPTGSVTRAQLYTTFVNLIKVDQLSKLWVYVTVSDVSTVSPINDSPKLGSSGDFSKDRTYRVKAADGSTKDYLLRTIKGF